MPYDFTLCTGTYYPLRHHGYRFTAEVLGRQDFFAQTPFDADQATCTYFIDNEAQIREIAYFIINSIAPHNH